MTQTLKTKLIESKTLLIGGAITLILTVIGHMASSTVMLAQLIPCYLFLGQPKMPAPLQQQLEKNDTM